MSAAPPSSCATDQRQVQVDQGNLSTAQSAEQQAEAQQAADLTALERQVSQAAAHVTSAQAALTAGDQPATPQQISTTEAQIQQDQASIATDKSNLSEGRAGGARSPGWWRRWAGRSASWPPIKVCAKPPHRSPSRRTSRRVSRSSRRVRRRTATPSPTFAALVSLDSMQTQLVVQVPQDDISQVHVGEQARATLPAVVGSRLTASVSAIQPTPVVQSGQTYFLVDLLTNSKALDAAVRSDKAAPHPSASPPVGFTVDVSF